ncbi:hypothetical protein RIR_jg26539.t1 [Rhizophagus irregularis DAOM 181602=DAOM 197198]|nr:hypothetical protein RIR_jg26539.t1 [Rhizophagus irregularis DAOM 181602=DAOM 197198]
MIRRRSINQIMGSEKIANQLSSKSSLTSLLLINQEEDSTITSHTRSYANRPQIMLEHSETEDLSNSDYKQHTDTSSSSDGNESDEELLPILLKIIHRQILNHIKRKKK